MILTGLPVLAVSSDGQPCEVMITPPSYQKMEGAEGWYALHRGSDPRPWILPRPGEVGRDGIPMNSCLPGNAVAAHWSPDGRLLAVEVDGDGGHSLCLYDLSWMKLFSRGPHKVQVRRLTSTGAIQGLGVFGARAARQASQMTEHDLTWGPKVDDQLPVAFSRSGAGPGYRVFGINDVLEPATATSKAMDGGGSSAALAPKYQTFQANWAPSAGTSPSPLALVVRDERLCGESHIGVVRSPLSKGLQVTRITEPCKDPTYTQGRVSDRYPVWRPGPGARELAFVRSVIGQSHRLCLISADKERCDLVHADESGRIGVRSYPGWSPQGQHLAWFFTPISKPGLEAPPGGENRIEVWDAGSEQTREVLTDIRANPRQPPAMVLMGETGRWVMAAAEPQEKDGFIVAARLNGSGAVQSKPTHLRTLIGVSAVHVALEGVRLALIAQGYQCVAGADMSGKKVYLMTVPDGQW